MSRTAGYLVRRLAWEGEIGHPFIESTSWQGSYGETVGPRHVAIALFLSEREANAEAYRLNQEARAWRSPFWFSHHLEEMTSLTLVDVAARLVRKGFAAPPSKHPEEAADETWRTLELWQEWWDRESVNWSAEQLGDAWAVFDKLRFYDVVEIELED